MHYPTFRESKGILEVAEYPSLNQYFFLLKSLLYFYKIVGYQNFVRAENLKIQTGFRYECSCFVIT